MFTHCMSSHHNSNTCTSRHCLTVYYLAKKANRNNWKFTHKLTETATKGKIMKGLPWRVVECILRAVNKLLQVSKQGKNKFWQQWWWRWWWTTIKILLQPGAVAFVHIVTFLFNFGSLSLPLLETFSKGNE